MIAICVEDRPLVLENLVRAVKASPYITDVAAFEDERDALEWAENNMFDAAFLDIELHVMTGLEVARRLARKNPEAFYIFCTAYREYAFDAIQLHLRIGYIMKPIETEKVVREISRAVEQRGKEKPLSVRCFGIFEAYVRGKPLAFRRRKTKELLAFLVDCQGAYVNTNELCAALWEGESDKKPYLRQLIMELRQRLAAEGVSEVFLTGRDSYAIDVQRIDCDYYRMMEGDKEAAAHFAGKYMAGYSWGEATCAWLISHLKDMYN